MIGRVAFAFACAWLALAASASAATWLPPQDISAGNQWITFPEVAVNAQGNAIAVWPRNDGGKNIVEVSERPAGGNWSVPVPISDPAGEQEPSNTHVALDSAGNAVAVWSSFDSGFVIRTAARPAGGEWSDPEDLSAPTGHTPQLAMNASGDAVAVWNGFNGTDYVTWAATRPVGGDWSAPEDLEVPGEGDAFYPQVSIDAAGNAIAVWGRQILGEDVIHAATRPAGGSWSAPEGLSTAGDNAREPEVAMNAAGTAVAAWSIMGGGVQAAVRPPGGSWSPAPEQVSALGQSAADPALAIDSNGNAFALWQGPGTGGQVLRAAVRPPGGGWSSPKEVSAVEQGFVSYKLAAHASVGVVATWTRKIGATTYGVQAAVRPPGGGWSEPEDLSPVGENAGLPDLGFDATGNAVAIWGREVGASDYVVQGAGYDFTGPRLDNLQIPATGTVGAPVSFAVSPFDLFALGTTSWAFGDGGQTDGNSVSHVYSAPGKYQVTVSAADGSGNVTTQTAMISVTDVTPPAPPQLLGTNPVSPSASGSPRITGNAEAGSTVRVYAGPTCAGLPVAVGSAAEFGSSGILVATAEGTTTTFSATATDAAGNTSACSASISYMRLKSIEPPPPAHKCIVPKLTGKTLARAKTALTAAACKLGQVRKPKPGKGKRQPRLVVKSSTPGVGASPADGKVDLTLRKKPKKTRR